MEELLQITRLGIKAIGGSGSKNHVWLFSKIPMNTAFYRMSKFDSGQNLLQFQFRQFGRISHKLADKNEVLSMLPKFSHLSFFA